jgi:hypothetical protein
LKEPEFLEVVEALDLFARVKTELLGSIEPKLAAGLRRKMPLDDFAYVGVKAASRCVDLGLELCQGGHGFPYSAQKLPAALETWTADCKFVLVEEG